MLNRLALIMLLGVLAGACWGSYRFVQSQMERQIYRDRLIDLSRQHELLRQQYNTAVRKTAVTELLVRDGRLEVQIRTANGVIETISTPFDPRHEIYVDYVVLDGRLWIRRVFDATTRPDDGVLIDPKLADIDWDAAHSQHGKAAYRRLGEGRWVVTVTGDGSLGLAARQETDPPDLATAPQVQEYTLLPSSTETADVDHIGFAELWRWVWGRTHRNRIGIGSGTDLITPGQIKREGRVIMSSGQGDDSSDLTR